MKVATRFIFFLSILVSQSLLAQNHPTEIVHIQTDKQYYQPGDTVWMKAYVVAGPRNLLTNLSQILYVDLIGADNQVLQKISLPLSFGIGVGDIVVPGTTSTDRYRIRAYTNWMRNFGEAYFFESDLMMAHSSTNSPKSEPSAIRLFPEGGSWSYGRPTRMVYRLGSADNDETFVESWLENEQGERLSDIPPPEGRLGEFIFFPQPQALYRIAFKNSSAEVIRQSLPPANTKGYGLAVNNLLEKHITVQVWSDPGAQQASLSVFSDGLVTLEIKLDPAKSGQAFHIPRTALSDGVNEIFLMSSTGEPLACRHVFNLPAHRTLALDINTDKPAYAAREKVRVAVTVGTDADSVRIGSFSVSVTPKGKDSSHNGMKRPTILSSLLSKPGITDSDFIQFPAFAERDAEGLSRLDRFMLTLPQGGITGTDPWSFSVERGLPMKGLVTNEAGEPQVGSRVTLFSPDTRLFLDTVTNEQGRFDFGSLLFYDGTNFIAQAHGSRRLTITLDDGLQEESARGTHIDGPSIAERPDPTAEQGRYAGDNSVMLNAVEIKGREERMRRAFNQKDPGEANRVIYANELQGCTTLEQCLQGRLAGVRFSDGKAYSTRTALSINSNPIPMAVIVDGVHIFEGGSGPSKLGGSNALSSISPSDVETIEVIRGTGTVIYGSAGAGGVLLITTKRGFRKTGNAEMPGVVHFTPKGLTPPSGIHSPGHASLYWNPNLLSDQNGNAFFDFYTGDEPGRYKISIEGIDLQGRVGISILEFEVQ